MLLDVGASTLDIFAHEHREQRVGCACAFERHAHQRAASGVHRRVPQLQRLHFAQTFEAFHFNASTTNFKQRAHDRRDIRRFDHAAFTRALRVGFAFIRSRRVSFAFAHRINALAALKHPRVTRRQLLARDTFNLHAIPVFDGDVPLVQLRNDALNLAVFMQFSQARNATAIDLHVRCDEIIKHEIGRSDCSARFGFVEEQLVAFRPHQMP